MPPVPAGLSPSGSTCDTAVASLFVTFTWWCPPRVFFMDNLNASAPMHLRKIGELVAHTVPLSDPQSMNLDKITLTHQGVYQRAREPESAYVRQGHLSLVPPG